MNTETVRDPGKIVNAHWKHWNGAKLKAIFHAANNSKLRYPLLVLTCLLLATVAITARKLTQDVLAMIQVIVDEWNIPL